LWIISQILRISTEKLLITQFYFGKILLVILRITSQDLIFREGSTPAFLSPFPASSLAEAFIYPQLWIIMWINLYTCGKKFLSYFYMQKGTF